MLVSDIYKTVEQDFQAVNTLISEQLSSDVPLVEKIAQYIVESGGKRMRPLLVLLTCKALGYTGSQHIKLAAIIEFLHTATLLHDDVVDASNLRRGKSTANAQWGNAPSVLVGDFLYSRAFQMMVDLKDMDIMETLSNATNVIAEGEVFQLMNCKNPDVTEVSYFEVIKNKTAMLFEAASHTAAILSNADASTTSAIQNFGLELGVVFQLVDDKLDYVGDAETMGKNVGDDLAEGKPTLPLIYAMQMASDSDSQLIRKAIRQGDASDLTAICKIVHDSGALASTNGRANEAFKRAKLCLGGLPESLYKDALLGLLDYSLHRNH